MVSPQRRWLIADYETALLPDEVTVNSISFSIFVAHLHDYYCPTKFNLYFFYYLEFVYSYSISEIVLVN